MRAGTLIPRSLEVQTEACSPGWKWIINLDGDNFDRKVRNAGLELLSGPHQTHATRCVKVATVSFGSVQNSTVLSHPEEHTIPELRAGNRTLPIRYALKESHLTVAPRVDRSLRVVSIALKFCNYAHRSIIDRSIDSASVQPFFD
jgi:hypothetical protein